MRVIEAENVAYIRTTELNATPWNVRITPVSFMTIFPVGFWILSAIRLFVQYLIHVNHRKIIKVPQFSPLLREFINNDMRIIGPAMRKALPCHDRRQMIWTIECQGEDFHKLTFVYINICCLTQYASDYFTATNEYVAELNHDQSGKG